MRPASWAAVLAVVVWSAAPASAQALDPAVSVDADVARLLVPHDEVVAASWTVTNDGPTDATVSLVLDVDGDVWETDFQDAYGGPFTLASGASRTLPLTVATTADGHEPLPDGLLRLTATATDAAGRTATAASEVVLAYGPAPPPLPPPDHTVRNALLATGAGLLLIAAAYVAVGRSVAVRPPAPEVTASARGTWVRMEVVNRLPWTRTVHVRTRTAAGTVATTDADVVLVPGRGVRPLTLFIRQVGDDGRVRVDARTTGYRWRRCATVHVVAGAADATERVPARALA